MDDEYTDLRRYNPTPQSTGMDMYEHWERDGGRMALLTVSSTPVGMELRPGDVILRRRWGPASEPEMYNRAKNQREGVE